MDEHIGVSLHYPDEAALKEGANQFKVNLNDIRTLYDQDSWVRNNVLVAVAAGNDGLSGISVDASYRAQREELGRFAHIIFSGQTSDRSYSLGEHPDFITNGHIPKPCLHGCDAHALEAVLEPGKVRRCWIRSEPTFDGLRQTLVEPERRVHIGESPPSGPHPGDVIRLLRFYNVPWMETHELQLNDGLVTIIGAKGAGKTALADLIAFAAGAVEEDLGPASFLKKASVLLSGLSSHLEWDDGNTMDREFPEETYVPAEPRARYLSQQFVEQLCTPGGLAEPLVDEIERVVFSAIPDEDRLECGSFSELRDLMLQDSNNECNAIRQSICTVAKQITDETETQQKIPKLQHAVQEAQRAQKSIQAEINSIPVKTSDDNMKAYQQVAQRLQILKDAIAKEERHAQELRDVTTEVQRQLKIADTNFLTLKTKYSNVLSENTWDLLRLRVHDNALSTLIQLEKRSREKIKSMRVHGVQDTQSHQHGEPESSVGLDTLSKECDRLSKELGDEQAKIRRRMDLQKKLVAARADQQKATRELQFAADWQSRTTQAEARLLSQYEALFGCLKAQNDALERLYAPLCNRVAEDNRLSKLTFVVQRQVDLTMWADRGEKLLDLRKPPFNRHGLLAETARSTLLHAWRSGTPQDIKLAMQNFREEHARTAYKSLAHGVDPVEFVEWLYSTDHISVRYGIQYEGVDIAHLSPGTRGVVLLTLYLALDKWDHRPLIIDQPEENLDPRSVYEDLVPFFRDAVRRRQVIMVTHNANLVVNTDSDQVIVAEARRSSPTGLPQIRYIAGGLEDVYIRSEVCRLLEGGEEAFRKRGQRYGTSFPRH